MKRKNMFSLMIASIVIFACSNDDDIIDIGPQLSAPTTYSFERNATSTVAYSGQTTRIQMGEQLISGLMDPFKTEMELDAMFAHQEGENNFTDSALNASDKNIRSKTAASTDYYSSNTTAAAVIKADFEGWIAEQVSEVYPNWANIATAGNPGQIQEAGGGPLRYVNAKGLELNQAVNKGLIGALMVDQMLNNYLSVSILDAGDNRANNDAGVLDGNNNYTTMEHKWDEAFGYLYGTDNASNPQLNQDSFLNKYLSRVENDADYTGVAQRIYDAFKLGRAAIVAKDYSIRDQQANIIREEISKIMAIRSVYYLQQAKLNFIANNNGAAFHDLSEGFGFIYGLQFTRLPGTDMPYVSKPEVDAFIAQLMEGDGFWDISNETLDNMSQDIATRFDLDIEQAGS